MRLAGNLFELFLMCKQALIDSPILQILIISQLDYKQNSELLGKVITDICRF